VEFTADSTGYKPPNYTAGRPQERIRQEWSPSGTPEVGDGSEAGT